MGKIRPKKAPIAIDLFSGCGGLTLGLKQAGYSVRAAVEIESRAQDTYALNHPEVQLFRADIRRLTVKGFMKAIGVRPGQIDLVAGCPPCQGFSRLRTKNQSASVHDERNDLIQDYLRFVHVLKPKSLMLENVPALQRDPRFKHLKSKLERMGYVVVDSVLNAVHYGVPQRRKRLILLASRVHRPELAKPSTVGKSVKSAIFGLPSPKESSDLIHAAGESRSERVREIIRNIPKNGGSRTDLPKRLQLNCHLAHDGFYDVYGRMRWSDPAPTITSGCINPSKGRFLHPSQNRTISLREAALLQGFPKSYKFLIEHGKEAIALMIGNALPPPLIAAHARALKVGMPLTRR